MADSPTNQQPLFQYRSVVLAITGFTAGYGLYTFYRTFVASHSSKTTLQRSNAVHRPRERQQQHSEELHSHDNPDHGHVPETEQGLEDTHDLEGQRLRALVYHIAEDDAHRKGYEHHGVVCSSCGMMPIRSIRWHCLNCPSFDLCSTCEQQEHHPITHVFSKIMIPLPFLREPVKPPRWYPAIHNRNRITLDVETKKRLADVHGFDETRIDALCDQFQTTASTLWPTDLHETLRIGIDRATFVKALMPDHWPKQATHNPVIDRMFVFFDTDNNGLIGFEEFLSGMSYLIGSRRFESLARALRGFDMDGDGYLNRADFVRILQAKFQLQRYLINDAVNRREEACSQSPEVMNVVMSSQPISSIFQQGDIPLGNEVRELRGKQPDVFGDMQPTQATILSNMDAWQEAMAGGRRDQSERQREGPIDGPSDVRPPDQSEGQNHDRIQVPDDIPNEVADPQPSQTSGQTRDQTLQHRNLSFEDILYSSYVNDTKDDREVDTSDIWWALEDGTNSILDKIFAAKESEDANALLTRDARQKWQEDVESLLKAQNQEAIHPPSQPDTSPSSSSENHPSNPAVAPENIPAPATEADDSVPISPSEPASNPADLTPPPPNDGVKEDNDEADKDSLYLRAQQLAQHYEIDAELRRRGGAGRLTLKEIEDLALADPSGQIRGLIKCWLDLARF